MTTMYDEHNVNQKQAILKTWRFSNSDERSIMYTRPKLLYILWEYAIRSDFVAQPAMPLQFENLPVDGHTCRWTD